MQAQAHEHAHRHVNLHDVYIVGIRNWSSENNLSSLSSHGSCCSVSLVSYTPRFIAGYRDHDLLNAQLSDHVFGSLYSWGFQVAPWSNLAAPNNLGSPAIAGGVFTPSFTGCVRSSRTTLDGPADHHPIISSLCLDVPLIRLKRVKLFRYGWSIVVNDGYFWSIFHPLHLPSSTPCFVAAPAAPAPRSHRHLTIDSRGSNGTNGFVPMHGDMDQWLCQWYALAY